MRRLFLCSVFLAAGFPGCRYGYDLLEPMEPMEPGGAGGEGGDRGIGGDLPTGGSDGAGTGGQDGVCSDWWDETLDIRRRLTFENGAAAEPLEDFPVLIVLTAQNFDYSSSRPGGADIRFLDDDHTTVLSHHIDTWNESGTSSIWVQVPRINATAGEDHIWMYYGGAADAPEDVAGTFDDAFRAVWHMSEETGGIVDVTSAGIECTWVGGGAGTQGTAGRIGLGLELDGAVDGAHSDSGQLAGLKDHTISAWVRPQPSGGDDAEQAIFSAEELVGTFRGPGLFLEQTELRVGSWVDGAYHFTANPENQLLAGEWAFVAMRGHSAETGGYVELKVNGGDWETVFSGSAASIAVVSDAPVQLGSVLGPRSARLHGRLDEVQVSAGLRSDSWVHAQYLSQGALGFVTVGKEEACP